MILWGIKDIVEEDNKYQVHEPDNVRLKSLWMKRKLTTENPQKNDI